MANTEDSRPAFTLPETDEERKLEELLAEYDPAWDATYAQTQGAGLSQTQTSMPLPYQEPNGEPGYVVPQTAHDWSLLERIAQYQQPVRDRLVAFERQRPSLAAFVDDLLPRQSQPDMYDDLLRKLLRKV